MADSLHTARRFLLEVCVDTASGVKAAAGNGCDRIELCAALAVGGLTPGPGLMRLAANCGVPGRAMIRPRAGDFTYSDDEVAIMRDDIRAAADSGLAGVALCVNTASGELDEGRLAPLVGLARDLGLDVALHRGFDLAGDAAAALETAVAMGVDTILSSGGATAAAEGTAGLAGLVRAAHAGGFGPRIEILAGGGVTALNAGDIVARSGVTALHASCSLAPVAPTGHAAVLGYVAGRATDPALVRALRDTLNAIESHNVLR